MKKQIIEIVKKIIFNYTNIGNPKYSYNVEPIQLAEIINSLEDLSNVSGNICEIGVARGLTTRFICEHLTNTNFKNNYYCIDTFQSFTDGDINYEIKKRNKSKDEISGFSYNNYEKWVKNFKEYKFLKAIKSDVKKINFQELSPLKFCFVDVDLYLPTKHVLENIPKYMVEGGIIIIDDVKANDTWDGAYQAFMEFVKDKQINYKIFGSKSGLIKF